jgi:hypothetical protein
MMKRATFGREKREKWGWKQRKNKIKKGRKVVGEAENKKVKKHLLISPTY